MLLHIFRRILLDFALAVYDGALFPACDDRAGFVGGVLRVALGLSALRGLVVGLGVWGWWACRFYVLAIACSISRLILGKEEAIPGCSMFLVEEVFCGLSLSLSALP